MTIRHSDGSIEAEQALLTAQSSASNRAQIANLENQIIALRHELYASEMDTARLAVQVQTLITIMARDGSLVAQSMLAHERALSESANGR